MDTSRYYSLKTELNNTIVQASVSYEGSLAKECDYYTVAKGLDSLISSYEGLNDSVSDQTSYSNNLEYDNISFFSSSTGSKIEPFIEKVRDLQSSINKMSMLAYNQLRIEFNSKLRSAQSSLNKANSAMNSYHTICDSLRGMSSDNPNYYSTKKAKEACVIAFDIACDMVSENIEILKKDLEDGYKRA